MQSVEPASYRFESVTAPDRQAVCTLIESAPFKMQLWPWQFVERDAEKDCIAVWYGPEIVGFNGVMPVRIWDGRAERPAKWSCDFVVRPDCRSQGLGQRIKQVLDERTDCLMSMGVSPRAASVLTKSGWRELAGPTVVRYVLRPLRLRERLFWAVRRLGPGGGPRPDAQPLEISDALPPPEHCERLWKRTREAIETGVVRDHRYLEWRYLRHPAGAYRYVTIGDRDAPRALVVVRWRGEDLVVVDYVGPFEAADLETVFSRLPATFPAARGFTARTSDRRLIRAMHAAGWATRGRPTRFFVRDEAGRSASSWYLTSGDSDGDALEAAQSLVPTYTIREWSEQAFVAGRAEWDRLLRASDADRLFASHAWQLNWWQLFGRPNGAELRVLAAHDANGALVGLTALVLDRVWRAGLPVGRRLQLLGHLWRGPATMRTEHCEFITCRGEEQPVCHALARHVAAWTDWDEFIVADVPYASMTFNAIDSALTRGAYVRILGDYRRGFAWAVDTRGDFAAYKASLGSDVRRRMFQQRDRLAERGTVECEVHEERGIGSELELLNRLHELRWGEPVFTGVWRDFHTQLAADLGDGDSARFEILKVDGVPVSILYNVLAGGTLYNIQSGFRESFAGGSALSVGLLHIGYSIEKAFADPRIARYDFLAGGGKRTFFKHRFCDTGLSLSRVHYVRTLSHRVCYRARDAIVGRYRGLMQGRDPMGPSSRGVRA